MPKISTGRVFSAFADGLNGEPVTIEVSITPGLPSFDIIGMCDASIRESKGRILTAIKKSGYSIPKGHITVSISPSFLRKKGSGFDLPIAIGVLMTAGFLPGIDKMRIFANGELTLNGEIHGTPGAVMRISAIAPDSYDACFIPKDEYDSAACCEKKCIFVSSFQEVCNLISKGKFEHTVPEIPVFKEPDNKILDFSALKGQEKASRAIFLAACGWHNILLIGSSGSGKTTASQIIEGLMPILDKDELKDVFKLNNGVGIETCISSDSYQRPFRTVTPSINLTGLIGSANGFKPGEISFADHGVLFVDELCEFGSKYIDSLRIPMEEHKITLKKAGKAMEFPANFLFVGATNPCRCGLYLEKPSKCTCSLAVRNNYLGKISGPFADRIDLVTEMYSVDAKGLKEAVSSVNEEKSRELRKKVKECWDIEHERYKNTDMPYALNGNFDSDNLSEILRADSKVIDYASKAASVGGYSVRSFKRLLKVGRTIADLDNRKDIRESDIAEAMSYRFRSKL
ncbi:MAG: ATP-binding protein [Clostridiales bacterium]|nr:ATP-binding protein [Clostridiales bacterium]